MHHAYAQSILVLTVIQMRHELNIFNLDSDSKDKHNNTEDSGDSAMILVTVMTVTIITVVKLIVILIMMKTLTRNIKRHKHKQKVIVYFRGRINIISI